MELSSSDEVDVCLSVACPSAAAVSTLPSFSLVTQCLCVGRSSPTVPGPFCLISLCVLFMAHCECFLEDLCQAPG